MSYRWDSVFLRWSFYPLDWLRAYAHWFRHSESAFLRAGPVELAVTWGLTERGDSCPLVEVKRDANVSPEEGGTE